MNHCTDGCSSQSPSRRSRRSSKAWHSSLRFWFADDPKRFVLMTELTGQLHRGSTLLLDDMLAKVLSAKAPHEICLSSGKTAETIQRSKPMKDRRDRMISSEHAWVKLDKKYGPLLGNQLLRAGEHFALVTFDVN